MSTAYDLSFLALGFGRPELVTYRDARPCYGLVPADAAALRVAHACGEHLVLPAAGPVHEATT